jgi:hypothetical protein
MSSNPVYFVVEEVVVEIKGVGCLMEEGRFSSVAKLVVMLKVDGRRAFLFASSGKIRGRT